MATRTITIKDAYIPEMINVFGHDYQTDIDDGSGGTIPNPQTKAQYADERFVLGLRGYVKSRVLSYRKSQLALDETDITDDNA